ncbi:MAG: ATP-dependent Clp protease proteolytic subunit [Cyanophyceae cyanobacterium]|jgi:ATP-dependent Clp protease protease subunit
MSVNEEPKEESEEAAEEQAPSPSLPPETRAVGVFQDITETKSEEIVYALKIYSGESDSPVEFYVNSAGGVASDMFAIYDYMRQTREEMEIHTHGLGKVMSAAVLLLAAGTKGKRKIGKYCRVMIHSVIGGSSGALHDLKNEMKEIQMIQDMYIDALASETKLTKKKLKDMFAKNVNVYLSAEEAVKHGIADIIV